jgi:Peptidase_C39 like family
MRTLPQLYSQQDPQWASTVLGTGNNAITIGTSGCYLTSFSMIANYYGHQINPLQLNQLFISNNLYVEGNELTDKALQSLYANCTYQQSIDYSNTPASLSILQTYLSDPTMSVILEVNANPEGPSSTLETHFVVAIACDGTNITIADPWTGQLNSGTPYGDWPTTIQKFVIYKGTPPATGTYVDSATFDTLVSKSTNYDAFVKIGYTEADQVTEKVSALQATIDNDNTDIGDLTKQNADLTLEVQQAKTTAADSAALLQKTLTSDSVAIDNGIKATQALGTLQDDMEDIAHYVGAKDDTKQDILVAIDNLKTQITTTQKTQVQTVKTSNQLVKTIIGVFTGRN